MKSGLFISLFSGHCVPLLTSDATFSSGQAGVWSYQPSSARAHSVDDFTITQLGASLGGAKVLAKPNAAPRAQTAPQPPPVVTKYYTFNGQRVAIRKNNVVTWVHADMLGSASLATDANGNLVSGSDTRYKPYGEVRAGGGGLPTDRLFTGYAREQASYVRALDFSQARYYSPYLGRFISADSIVPGAGNLQAWNRYSYSLNSPLRHVDPSGHDPIDAGWEREFERDNDRAPTDQDRRNRLFSLLFRGAGVGGTWTAADWAKYAANPEAYWSGARIWNGQAATGVDSFADHVDKLSTYYFAGEEDAFVSATGLVWGGIPYTNRLAASFASLSGPVTQPLFESNANWEPSLIDAGDPNQSHHWAGLFYTGYYFEAWFGFTVNVGREVNQIPPNTPDIVLGNFAVTQGRMLGVGIVNISEVGDMIRQTIDARPAIWPPNSPASRSLRFWDYIP